MLLCRPQVRCLVPAAQLLEINLFEEDANAVAQKLTAFVADALHAQEEHKAASRTAVRK